MAKDAKEPKSLIGAVSRFAEKDAPKEVRKALEKADKDEILDPGYPYRERLDGDEYEKAYDACQLELVKLQRWVHSTGQRLVFVFEGRDAAGKGGAIQAITENMNPRYTRIAALPAPSDVERGQWYFQRYIAHLPTRGEVVLFDRSWYNRAIVEHVFGWCTDDERNRFFQQVPEFEDMLVRDGIVLIKVWLAISRAEQLRQFLQRENGPAEAVEAQPGRRRRPRALGCLFRSDRRDVQQEPPLARPVGRGLERGQAPGAARGDAVAARAARLSRQGGDGA